MYFIQSTVRSTGEKKIYLQIDNRLILSLCTGLRIKSNTFLRSLRLEHTRKDHEASYEKKVYGHVSHNEIRK